MLCVGQIGGTLIGGYLAGKVGHRKVLVSLYLIGVVTFIALSYDHECSSRILFNFLRWCKYSGGNELRKSVHYRILSTRNPFHWNGLCAGDWTDRFYPRSDFNCHAACNRDGSQAGFCYLCCTKYFSSHWFCISSRKVLVSSDKVVKEEDADEESMKAGNA